MERLAEARETGAGTLVTACPKCEIHFKCADHSFESKMAITDIYDLVVDHLTSNG